MILGLSLLCLAIWLWLWLGHAGFWRIDRAEVPPPPLNWPEVIAVIPARNEEEGIAETLRSLWSQDYPNPIRIVLVDDHCEDGTVTLAREAARNARQEGALCIVEADCLPAGWTGKVWAMDQGVRRGIEPGDAARYILFSDADISHGPSAVWELVCRAEAGACDLTSFMVRLQCRAPAERLMIPAFVFFFKMLYPFRRINNASNPLAGAAGGTMLVRREALARIGGLASIRSELIDDCALAREIKRGGHPIWLGLSDTSISTRHYRRLPEILHMVARTAYTQLGCSPFRLAGCIAGLALVYLAPPILLLACGWPALFAGLAWLLMTLLYLPMVRFYRQSPLWSALLPVTALLYLAATILSAWRWHRGRGGQWKGRSQAGSAGLP